MYPRNLARNIYEKIKKIKIKGTIFVYERDFKIIYALVQRTEHRKFSFSKGTLRWGLFRNPIGRRVLRVSHGAKISGKYVETMVRCVWEAMEMLMC